jgi:hypothetical protein
MVGPGNQTQQTGFVYLTITRQRENGEPNFRMGLMEWDTIG